ncbi:hypothetical protein [Corallococcus sicarius]|uniref:Uncharacterized protein n=1 Tax=Corallococcus sicarius TaxID=2316726 RepID=A0A3A8NW41_9BACT|nr:hypothetical protein [Corallococcus sicarius]RKH44332.1 hypothetical protein D7X12_10790 [Corallococcus sicarius]
MANLLDFKTVLTELRAARNALPQETAKNFLGLGGSKVYKRDVAKALGQDLIDICSDCVNALEDRSTARFNFNAEVAVIDALLNIQMVTKPKAQVQRLHAAALTLKGHCQTTATLNRLDAVSTRNDWNGAKAIDVVMAELNGNRGLLTNKQLAGRAQLIINNAGDPANIDDGDGWNSSRRAVVADPMERVPEGSRDLVGFAKEASLDDRQVGALAICHATAAGMINVLGRKHATYKAGGRGPVLRGQAQALAVQLLSDRNKLYLLHFRCTAQADGHSFMLCMNHDDTVTISESWANPGGNGLFLELQGDKVRRGRAEISNANAIGAVNRIFDVSPAVRTQGYTRLSQAYDDSVRYELRAHDEHAAGHHCGDGCRANDADISIVVRARQLTRPATVRNRLTELRGVYDAIP